MNHTLTHGDLLVICHAYNNEEESRDNRVVALCYGALISGGVPPRLDLPSLLRGAELSVHEAKPFSLSGIEMMATELMRTLLGSGVGVDPSRVPTALTTDITTDWRSVVHASSHTDGSLVSIASAIDSLKIDNHHLNIKLAKISESLEELFRRMDETVELMKDLIDSV